MLSLPNVLFVGGPDVDARLELMHCLKDTFSISALGSLPTLRDRLLAEGFRYNSYRLARQVMQRPWRVKPARWLQTRSGWPACQPVTLRKPKHIEMRLSKNGGPFYIAMYE